MKATPSYKFLSVYEEAGPDRLLPYVIVVKSFFSVLHEIWFSNRQTKTISGDTLMSLIYFFPSDIPSHDFRFIRSCVNIVLYFRHLLITRRVPQFVNSFAIRAFVTSQPQSKRVNIDIRMWCHKHVTKHHYINLECASDWQPWSF